MFTLTPLFPVPLYFYNAAKADINYRLPVPIKSREKTDIFPVDYGQVGFRLKTPDRRLKSDKWVVEKKAAYPLNKLNNNPELMANTNQKII